MIYGCVRRSGVTLSEVARHIASEHLDLPPQEYGRMLTPLVGEAIHEAEQEAYARMVI
jgi:hypothetical protein